MDKGMAIYVQSAQIKLGYHEYYYYYNLHNNFEDKWYLLLYIAHHPTFLSDPLVSQILCTSQGKSLSWHVQEVFSMECTTSHSLIMTVSARAIICGKLIPISPPTIEIYCTSTTSKYCCPDKHWYYFVATPVVCSPHDHPPNIPLIPYLVGCRNGAIFKVLVWLYATGLSRFG